MEEVSVGGGCEVLKVRTSHSQLALSLKLVDQDVSSQVFLSSCSLPWCLELESPGTMDATSKGSFCSYLGHGVLMQQLKSN